MKRPTVDGWDPARSRRAGRALARILRARAGAARAVAEGLAPPGPGPGVRLHVYETGLDAPRAVRRFQDAYAGIEALFAALEAGDPGAVELGLEVASRLDADAVTPVAAELLAAPGGPWLLLGKAAGRALGRSGTREAFRLLLAHRRLPYVAGGPETASFEGGAAEARAALEEIGDLARRDLDPRDRLLAFSLLGYLVRFDPGPTWPLVERLFRDGGDEVFRTAGRLLIGRGTASSLALVASALDDPRPGARRLAISALLAAGARGAVDALGGPATLASEAGRARAGDLLDLVARDAEDGERGRASHGWLAADPRLVELAAACRQDRRLKDAAAAVLRHAGPGAEAAAKARVPLVPIRAPAKARPPRPPGAAVVAELEAARAALDRLVRHLARTGYRFADRRRALRPPTALARKALARLEKALGPVPVVLRAFWEVVGSVDLRGQHPRWPRPACVALPGGREEVGTWWTDPLVIRPPDALVEEALDEALEDAPHALRLAPDIAGKAGYSGGTLDVWLPALAADADDPRIEGGPVEGETLRAHLARSLAWGGFPGFAAIPDRPEPWLAAAREAVTGRAAT